MGLPTNQNLGKRKHTSLVTPRYPSKKPLTNPLSITTVPQREDAMQLLSKQALTAINAGLSFSRDTVQPGILHFSTGNFHRAHQCSYYNDLFAQADSDDSGDLKWGIIGASTRDGSYTDMRPALEKQNFLYTLVETDDKKTDPQVIGSIIDMLPYADDHKPIKEKLLDENIKIVSMTVTEGGYFIDGDNEFDADAEPIQHDAENPDDPQTVFGLIIQALKQRRERGMKPFTVMSCDNVPQNGSVAKKTTVGLAKLIDEDLANWIDENVDYPCSMVDRITPAPTTELRESVDLDYEDESPIFCEPFRQWVIEDKFTNNERPPLDKVGVKFVDDVTPWEEAKLRILNAGHASLCYPAHLLGFEFVHEAMEHDVIPQFLDKMQRTEIIPHVPPVPDTDMEEYWETVCNRYKNSKLSDSIKRNCANGSDRQPKFILPSIKACLNEEKGTGVNGLATVSAMWCKYCMGKTESGEDIEPNDDMWDMLHEAATKAKDDSCAWLTELEDVYGDLGRDEEFQDAFDQALKLCLDKGVEAAMKQYVDSD